MKEELYPFIYSEEFHPFFAELVGISFCDGSYHILRKNSPLYVLEYIVYGTGTIIFEGKRYTASKGDVYILEPGDHNYFSDGDWPWTKIFLNTTGSLVPALLKAYNLQNRVVFPDCPVEPIMREVIELVKNTTSPKNLMELLSLKVHELILAIARNQSRENTHSEEAYLLKNLIDESTYQRVSIEQLTQAIYRSPDYVIKMFKKEFGMTPYAYATHRKIMAAQQLLRDSRMQINEIAALLSYPDAHYFSHLFRRHTGCTPSEYRRMSRQ